MEAKTLLLVIAAIAVMAVVVMLIILIVQKGKVKSALDSIEKIKKHLMKEKKFSTKRQKSKL